MGVFAGRAFKTEDVVLTSWMTLLLPDTFPRDEPARDFVFDHNKTHMALSLGYGSLMNHHESFNTRVTFGFSDIHVQVFQVRRCFQFANHNAAKTYECIYT